MKFVLWHNHIIFIVRGIFLFKQNRSQIAGWSDCAAPKKQRCHIQIVWMFSQALKVFYL